MATLYADPAHVVVRDPKTGRMVTVRGVGALKGQLLLEKRVDLTKPIAAQASGAKRKRRPAAPVTQG